MTTQVQGVLTHRWLYSGDSTVVLRLSSREPSVPSFRRDAAVILLASAPPSGYLRLRSWGGREA